MARMRPNMLTIGEVARSTGVAATALRYYERENILSPAARSGAGYRLYDAEAVERLRFVRAAQTAGFNLDDIRALLELRTDDPTACKSDVRRLLERRIADVDVKLKELRRVRRSLARALQRCLASDGECAVLTEFNGNGTKRRRE